MTGALVLVLYVLLMITFVRSHRNALIDKIIGVIILVLPTVIIVYNEMGWLR